MREQLRAMWRRRRENHRQNQLERAYQAYQQQAPRHSISQGDGGRAPGIYIGPGGFGGGSFGGDGFGGGHHGGGGHVGGGHGGGGHGGGGHGGGGHGGG